jgi:hypothetical protein
MKLIDNVRKALGQHQVEVHFQKVKDVWYYADGKPELVVNLKEIEDLKKAEKLNDFSEWENKRILVMHINEDGLDEWYFSKYGDEVTDEKILKRLEEGHKPPKKAFKNPFAKKQDEIDGYQRYFWINEKWYKLNPKNIETNPVELEKLDKAYEKDKQESDYHAKGIWPIRRNDNKVYYIYLDEFEKDEKQIEILEKGKTEQMHKMAKFASEMAKVRPPIETLDQLLDCISEWELYQYRKGLIPEYHGSFIVFNPEKKFEVTDNAYFASGIKETTLMSLEDEIKEIKELKEDFIHWGIPQQTHPDDKQKSIDENKKVMSEDDKKVKQEVHEKAGITLDNVMNIIGKWVDSMHEKDLWPELYASFIVMNPDKEFEFVDDKMVTFGTKESLVIGMSEHLKAIKKSKEEDGFINW